ncbi:MAG: ABC transporter ATP-binding protein, partial [Clostridia bacterium]|nr:ABC transporter ATP-binding protein [Clostridia bacterium]
AALVTRPALVVADEPVSALDVTVAAGILDLIRNLRDETGAGFLFISHDLNVIATLCDRVLVMHEGRVVEEGSVQNVFSSPSHPYTKRLLETCV